MAAEKATTIYKPHAIHILGGKYKGYRVSYYDSDGIDNASIWKREGGFWLHVTPETKADGSYDKIIAFAKTIVDE